MKASLVKLICYGVATAVMVVVLLLGADTGNKWIHVLFQALFVFFLLQAMNNGRSYFREKRKNK